MSLPSIEKLPDRLRYVREEVMRIPAVEKLAAEFVAHEQELGYKASHQTIWRYERGESFDLQYAVALASLSGAPLDWIVLNRTQVPEANYVLHRFRQLAHELDQADLMAEMKARGIGKGIGKALHEKDQRDAEALPPGPDEQTMRSVKSSRISSSTRAPTPKKQPGTGTSG